MHLLVARFADGRLYTLSGKASRDTLKKLRTETSFYCPSCGGEVRLRIGDITIPHFAHLSLALCASFSEPESQQHLEGKLLLKQWADTQQLDSRLETYFPTIQQRADLLLQQKAAIEFQLSPIPFSEVLRRSAGYHSLDLAVHWISGTTAALSDGIQVVKIKHYETGFFERVDSLLYFRVFSPTARRFYYFSHLTHVSGTKWIANVTSLPLNRQHFPFLVPSKLSLHEFQKLQRLYKEERHRFIRSQVHVRRKYQDPFWLCMYELQLDRDNLPPIIGIPLPDSYLFRKHAVIWQLQLLAALQKGKTVEAFLKEQDFAEMSPGKAEAAATLVRRYLAIYKQWYEEKMTVRELDRLIGEIACKSL